MSEDLVIPYTFRVSGIVELDNHLKDHYDNQKIVTQIRCNEKTLELINTVMDCIGQLYRRTSTNDKSTKFPFVFVYVNKYEKINHAYVPFVIDEKIQDGRLILDMETK